MGYIRCGLPDDWWDSYDKAWNVRHRVLSRSTNNQWFYEQRNLIRRFANKIGARLERCFFDAEDSPMEFVGPLVLFCRDELAKLFVAASQQMCDMVIVDDRCRLDNDKLICSMVCREFAAIDVPVVEAKTGAELTVSEFWEPHIAAASHAKYRTTERRLRSWKALTTRIRSDTRAGRKPFGQNDQEQLAISRIRELRRVLPRDQWKRRSGGVVKRRSYREIARCLNEEEVPTRTGVPWSDRTVAAVLKRLRPHGDAS